MQIAFHNPDGAEFLQWVHSANYHKLKIEAWRAICSDRGCRVRLLAIGVRGRDRIPIRPAKAG